MIRLIRWIRHLPRALAASLLLVGGLARAQEAPAPAQPPAPLEIRRLAGEIVLDGDLSDSGWTQAATFDQFFETNPGDNLPAKVTTQVWVTYDDRFFYLAVRADDPDPSKIRAPFVDRDKVFGTDDNIAVFLDPRNDRRSAIELRVNPRGIQGDAVFNDATGNEDFSPDFFYDTAAAITATGWNAEYRVPLSSLRYPEGSDATPQTWGILVWRNYPRDYRYGFHSAPLPRGSNCSICRSHELTGFRDLPRSRHLTVAPYANAQAIEDREPTAGADWGEHDQQADAGLDVKWNPTSSSAIDLTINPDFSQVESDEAQITANERFALFFPEKRTFFLEGADLFDTPFQAVYTRSITAPDWGLRATGKVGAMTYTALLAEDAGGGGVIVPFATFSDFAPQDFRSTVAITRLRRDFGQSFGGLIATAREIKGSGGGHNYVIGPDFQWRPDGKNQLTAQFLWSDTENPERPDLSQYFDGDSQGAHAFRVNWSYNVQGHDFFAGVDDVGDGFRADSGFVTRAGYRQLQVGAGLRRYPDNPWISFLRTYTGASVSDDRHGERLDREVYLGAFGFGRKNLQVNAQLTDQEVLVGGRLLGQTYADLFFQIDPSRRITRVGAGVRVGDAIDFANGREGDGLTWVLRGTFHPTAHLELEALWNRRTVEVTGGRLFTASVERLRATYVFSSRQLIRVIGQNTETVREAERFLFPVPARTGDFAVTGLYSFKLNWQTVLFLGYGDERLLAETDRLEPTRRSVFFKVSYAIQR